MSIEAGVTDILKEHHAGVFLFIGSGVARRYLGLEDWAGLLRKFCSETRDFDYYFASSNGHLPSVATMLAQDFHEVWWNSSSYAESRDRHKGKITDKSSALRVEICDYLKHRSAINLTENPYADEISALGKLSLDGIVTTNWDTFLEDLFPRWKVYVGQEQLLFSTPQSIGEIYKIHGDIKTPRSLILTAEDYIGFNERNAYLAAKLITIFVEHPVIFMGYSATDENILGLLQSIAVCIGERNLSKLRNNLIFVHRLKDGQKEGIAESSVLIGRERVPVTEIRTNDFTKVYRAIETKKRAIPSHILRFFKEQMYELVKTTDPHDKIYVVDIDEVDGREGIEFVVGVGVAKEQARLADQGYALINVPHLISDMLYRDKGYDARRLLGDTIPKSLKHRKYVPVFYLLRAIGISAFKEYKASGFDLDKWVDLNPKDFRSKSQAKQYHRHYSKMSAREIIDRTTPEIAAQFLPFIDLQPGDQPLIEDFLKRNVDRFQSTAPYSSAFVKLASLYDRVYFGFN
ncbi:Phage protein [Paraburkholderia sacchari]|uniref:SIR2 family protein n=1 Tax=Paraburkholderia sacchari TaxID=159450 RepID=UPI0039A62A31